MALMLASSQWASAQSRSVKVNVQDSWGPVAGASVLIKGTTTGDVTDLDGNATITNIEESSVLVVSFIGYTSQEIVVGKQTQINVVMKEDTELLDVWYPEERVFDQCHHFCTGGGYHEDQAE